MNGRLFVLFTIFLILLQKVLLESGEEIKALLMGGK